MRIAIVNDMSMAIDVLRHVIEGSSHQVAWVAMSGDEAIDKCKENLPDLILMDMVMPGMNGVETTRRIMEDTPCAILVVTVSVSENASLVFDAMGAGAIDAVSTPEVGVDGKAKGTDEFLTKLKRIEKLLNLGGATQFESKKSVCQAKGTMLAIGSSTGGPNAVAQVLRPLPDDFPASIVVVQHVDKVFAEGFAQWLGTQTHLKVKVAEDGDVLEPSVIYVACTNNHLIYDTNGRLKYTDGYQEIVYRPSVDVFFNSLVDNWRGNLLAVLLTGMGRDGAEGLLRLRKKGVYTIAQDKDTCAVYGMPKAAAELDAAVTILPLDEIPRVILNQMRNFK